MDLLPEIQERRLVVAIDYGTTHTSTHLASSKLDLEKLLINMFRGRMGHTCWLQSQAQRNRGCT